MENKIIQVVVTGLILLSIAVPFIALAYYVRDLSFLAGMLYGIVLWSLIKKYGLQVTGKPKA